MIIRSIFGLASLAASYMGIDYAIEGPRKPWSQCQAEFHAADKALNPNDFDLTQNTYKYEVMRIDNARTACREHGYKDQPVQTAQLQHNAPIKGL